VVGTGAKILGNITIGEYAKVGAGSVVVRPVPAHCTVVGVPGRIVGEPDLSAEERNEALEHGKLPDPQAQAMEEMSRRIAQPESQIHDLAADRDRAARR